MHYEESMEKGPHRLLRAHDAAERSGISALVAEVEAAERALGRPAARVGETTLTLAEVERVLASDALIVDGCRRAVRAPAFEAALAELAPHPDDAVAEPRRARRRARSEACGRPAVISLGRGLPEGDGTMIETMRKSTFAALCALTLLSAGCEDDPVPTRPAVADANDWCAEHALPESMCAECNPELASRFQEAGDWYAGHGQPESVCPLCHPMEPPPGHSKLEGAGEHNHDESHGTGGG